VSRVTIRAENLSKQFQIGPAQPPYHALREYMRLAFALAAHLEPEILIVDEVLAVGDLNFQNKCLGKMQDVASRGRTVLFVSHNMGESAISAPLARRRQDRRPRPGHRTVAAYLQSVGRSRPNDTSHWKHKGSGEARFMNARLLDSNGEPRETFGMGESVVVEFDMELSRSFSVAPDVHRCQTGGDRIAGASSPAQKIP
jgi:lipopolysaccharide transport system ATP-binding protein